MENKGPVRWLPKFSRIFWLSRQIRKDESSRHRSQFYSPREKLEEVEEEYKKIEWEEEGRMEGILKKRVWEEKQQQRRRRDGGWGTRINTMHTGRK